MQAKTSLRSTNGVVPFYLRPILDSCAQAGLFAGDLAEYISAAWVGDHLSLSGAAIEDIVADVEFIGRYCVHFRLIQGLLDEAIAR